jgi:hypothetical protein
MLTAATTDAAVKTWHERLNAMTSQGSSTGRELIKAQKSIAAVGR